MASIELTGELPGRRLLRFRAAGEMYACDLGVVREIVRVRPVTRLPGTPAWVMGIMNLRGTLLTVVDLSARLGGTDVRPPAVVMVVEAAGRRIGLGVEAVVDVADAAAPAGDEDAWHDAGSARAGAVNLGDGAGGAVQWCEVDAIAREALAV